MAESIFSSPVVWTAFLLACSVGASVLLLRNRRRLKLPPGPEGNLFSGYAFRLSNKRYYDFTAVGQQYGEVCSIRIFSDHLVLLNSYEAIREAFVENADWLSGRSKNAFDREFSNHGFGLVASEGDIWKEHRRFSLSVLKDFGLGKSKIESTIQDELEYFRSELLAQKSRAIDVKTILCKAVSNVICSLVFSERCGQDSEFESILEMINKLMSEGPRSVTFYAMWTLFKYLPGDFSGLKQMMNTRSCVHAYVRKRYVQHRQTFKPDNIRDYIDAFLFEMQKEGSKTRWFTEEQLCQSVWDLFLAGTETTATTLQWGIAFMAKYPHVQRKAQEEIDEVIGLSKPPKTADKLKLRYVDAVLCEIQRYATIGPFALPHTATDSRQLRGYDIEKDTMLIANVWSVHRNAPCWKDPNNFNPENFLDEKRNVVNTNYLISFGLGKRACLGEQLARQELFIFLTGLLQHFDIMPDPDSPLPGIDDCECKSIVRSPRPYRVIFKPRAAR